MEKNLYPTEQQTFSVSHHGRNVSLTCFLPQTDASHPMVIFSHGYNGAMMDQADSARFLAQHGIGAVCLSFCGGGTRDRSGFPSTEMTVFTEKEDLLAVIRAVSGWDRTAADGLFLFGESMGGLVSALTAKELPEQIRGLILLYPALCVADDWRKRFPDEAAIPDTLEFWGLTLGKSFFTSIRHLDVLKEIGGYSGNVLLMHGTADPVVPFSYSMQAKERFPRARLELFEGEGHGFTENSRQIMTKMMLSFLQDCLR